MTKSIRTLEMQGPQGKIKITLEGPIVKHFLSIAQVLEMFLNDEMNLNKTNSLLSSIFQSESDSNNPGNGMLSRKNDDLKVNSIQDNSKAVFDNMTIIDRLKHLIRATIRMGWANSREIKELYEYHFQTEVSLSTVSTYLKRLSEDGILEKRGSKSNLEYRLNPAWFDQIPELELPRPSVTLTTTNDGKNNQDTNDILEAREANANVKIQD